MPRKLTQAQIDAYDRDGFVAPVQVISPEDANRFRLAYERAERQYPHAVAGAGRNNAHLNFTCLDELVHHRGVLDAVEDLIGPNILVAGSVLFVKEANDPGFVSWHQDVTYMGLEPHDGVTAWIALSPSNSETGCMRMIPGTHKGGIREHLDTFGGDNILTRGQTVPDANEASAVDVTLEPGEMSLHHLRVIHGSTPNRGADRRIGFAIQSYLPPHVRQTKGVSYVQVARGRDTYGHFPVVSRPTVDMAPADVALRERVDRCWSDILYHGAEQRRDY